MAKKEKKIVSVDEENTDTPEVVEKKETVLVEKPSTPAPIPEGFYIQLTLSGEYVVCKEGKIMSKPMPQAKAEDTMRRFNR